MQPLQEDHKVQYTERQQNAIRLNEKLGLMAFLFRQRSLKPQTERTVNAKYSQRRLKPRRII